MIIELGDNGLRDHYHWSIHNIDDQSIDRYCTEARIEFRSTDPHTRAQIAAYLATRSACPFLTDDNHDWIAKDYGPWKAEQQALKDLTQSSRYSIVIQRKPGNERRELYPSRYWFRFAYRVPGQPY